MNVCTLTKRTSDMQREALSDMLNKKPQVDGNTSAFAVPVYPSTSHNRYQ